jgi:hypothetical protein
MAGSYGFPLINARAPISGFFDGQEYRARKFMTKAND